VTQTLAGDKTLVLRSRRAIGGARSPGIRAARSVTFQVTTNAAGQRVLSPFVAATGDSIFAVQRHVSGFCHRFQLREGQGSDICGAEQSLGLIAERNRGGNHDS